MFEQISAMSSGPAMQMVHGELVTFGGDGADKPITAIIDRTSSQIVGLDRNQRIEYQAIATIYFSDVTAIIPGGQTVTFKLRKGDTANETLTVVSILSQDGASWRVALN